jgi:archaellum component FlaG (FlaF/FlaG flagellin family)
VRQTFRSLVMACTLIAIAVNANGPATTKPHAAAVRDNNAYSQERSEIQIVRRPDQPFIERRNGQQLINFDLLIKNAGSKTYNLVCIKVQVFDKGAHLELERELNENGKPPALNMVGERLLQPGKVLDVYQPFYSFDTAVDVSRMQFELLFMEQGHTAPPAAITADEMVSVDVRPRSYNPVAFSLPLHGLVLVHDGHDFYSHHRRYNLVARYEADPSSAVSANLYAYDFMRTTSAGLLFQGEPNRKENWLSYGEPIFAPADGLVIEVVSDLPENTFTSTGEAQSPSLNEAKDPMGFGNHVKIQHADGRVSWLLHMQPSSIRVRVGDHVRDEQLIGRVGFSGDSLFPHLHYNVTDGPSYPSQGVPSCFKQFVRVLGERRIPMSKGQIDTSDIVETWTN